MCQPRRLLAGLFDILVENGCDFGNQFHNALLLFWSQIDEHSLLPEVAQSNSVIPHITPLAVGFGPCSIVDAWNVLFECVYFWNSLYTGAAWRKRESKKGLGSQARTRSDNSNLGRHQPLIERDFGGRLER